MNDIAQYNEKFNSLKVCVIVPTYNNGLTLAGIIGDVLQYTKNVIVVNDGSTDGTLAIIKEFPAVEIISYPRQHG